MRTTYTLVLCLTAGISGAPLHLPSARTAVPEEISELNECIQKRFLDRTAFGMRRILPNGFHGVRQFRPENPRETALLDRLQSQGYEVALYLTGRDTLTPSDGTIEFWRRAVQGPAYITQLPKPEALPAPTALLDESKFVMLSSRSGAGYDVQLGEWTVALRPLRAQNETCVQCHVARALGSKPDIRIGDALGVVSYVYRCLPENR